MAWLDGPQAAPRGRIVQVAYAVDDVHAAAARTAEALGAGPFFTIRHAPLRSARHGGASGAFDHSSAYGQWGAVQIELVQVHEASPPALADIVEARSGIHHVAWFCDSIDAEQDRLEGLGWPCVLDAETAGGFRFAFHDARAALGHLVEIYEPHEPVLALYGKVASAAVGWAGEEPVRQW